MPRLGDYLGSILAEITRARVQADLESARIAEVYSEHELLRHFAIPRLRLPKVDVDVPVLISETGEGETDEGGEENEEPHSGRLDPAVVADWVIERLREEVRDYELEALDRDVERLRTRLRKRARRHLRSLSVSVSLRRLARDICRELPSELQRWPMASERLTEDDRAEITGSVTEALKGYLADRLPISGAIQVSPLTQDLRETRGERLVHLKLSVIEEGLEWVKIEDEGTEREVLVPE